MDTADACHAVGVQTVAVTAGYIGTEARRDFYAKMDAANVDLKAFTDDFYVKLCGANLQPVLDTLAYIKRETACWLEITTLLIPGKNDSDAELEAMCAWIMRELGPDVPLHFTAFHPDYKVTTSPRRRRRRCGGRATSRCARGCTTSTRERPRSRRRHDLLPRLRQAADRPRLARDRALRADVRGAVPALRRPGARALRGLPRPAEPRPHPRQDVDGGVSLEAGAPCAAWGCDGANRR